MTTQDTPTPEQHAAFEAWEKTAPVITPFAAWQAAVELDRQQRGEPAIVVRVVRKGHEVADPEIVQTSAAFDDLPHGTELSLYPGPQPAEPVKVPSLNAERLAMEAVMESVDPATWPGLTIAQRCALGRFAKPHLAESAEPVGVDDFRACAIGDSNYAAGMLSGWNLCIAEDGEAFNRIRGDRLRAAAQASRAARAQGDAPIAAQPVASAEPPIGYVHLVPDEFSDSYDVRFWRPVPIGTKLYATLVAAQPSVPSELIAQLLEYASNPGYSHIDYADTMREAADTLASYGAPIAAQEPVASTSAATWRMKGEPDPHGNQYDCERAALCMGNLTDDELANAAFMNYDQRPPLQDIIDGKARSPIAYMTAVKDRIRWLSRALAAATPQPPTSAQPTASPQEGSDGTLLKQFLAAAKKDGITHLTLEQSVVDPDFVADLARSRAKYLGNARMFDGLMGEIDELRRAYAGDGDIRAEAFDVAACAYRIATEGDTGGNTLLAQPAASAEPCATCNDNGIVGNILNAEPCPDCTPPADGQAQQDADRVDAERYRHLRENSLTYSDFSKDGQSGWAVMRMRMDSSLRRVFTYNGNELDAVIDAARAQQGGQ